jgi:hypothetical protein
MNGELVGVMIVQTLFVMILIYRTRCRCHHEDTKSLRAELMACKKNLTALRRRTRKETL